MSAIRRSLIAGGCAAAVLAGITACGPVESISAGHQVDEAVAELGEQRSLSIELSLDADPALLEELIEQSDAGRSGAAGRGDGPPPGFGKFLSKARVELSMQAKKPLSDADEKDLTGTSMKISGADGVLAEYRALGEDTYYRADFDAFGKIAGAPMPSADDLPEEAAPLRSVLEGGWVKAAPGILPGPGPQDTLGEGAQNKLIKGIQRVIAREVTFKDDGGTDGTDHITAKANARSLLTALAKKLEPMADELPPGSELPTAKDLKSVPDKEISVAFELKDGKLREVAFDIAQFADKSDGLKKGTKLPLKLKFGEAEKIERPADATELNPSDLMFFAGAPELAA